MPRLSPPLAFAAISWVACLPLATVAIAADPVSPRTRWEQSVEPMPIAGTEAAAKPGAAPAFTVPAGFAVDRLLSRHRSHGDDILDKVEKLRDLTGGGRFQVKDLLEATMHPSKVVSDQYKASIVQTVDGKVHIGRVVAETPDQITASTESLMPRGLLDQLNESEVLDLLAYTLSRGNKNGPRFKKD